MATCTRCTHAFSAFVAAHDLIPPGGDVTCLVSGGADSTCLWHSLRELGYRVGAVHVHHGTARRRGRRGRAPLRRADGRRGGRGSSPRRPRRRCATSATGQPRAAACARPGTRPPIRSRRCSTGSSRADRLAASRPRREDGVVRPLLEVTRDETDGLLPRARPARARRRDQRSDEARADPRRAAPAAPPSRPTRRRQPALARRRRATPPSLARAVARRAALEQ